MSDLGDSWSSQVALVVKNLPAKTGDARDTGLIPKGGRSPGGGHGNPLQYSCLENPHRQRSLAGYSPWGHKESDTSEQLSTAHNVYIIHKRNNIHLKLTMIFRNLHDTTNN